MEVIASEKSKLMAHIETFASKIPNCNSETIDMSNKMTNTNDYSQDVDSVS